MSFSWWKIVTCAVLWQSSLTCQFERVCEGVGEDNMEACVGGILGSCRYSIRFCCWWAKFTGYHEIVCYQSGVWYSILKNNESLKSFASMGSNFLKNGFKFDEQTCPWRKFGYGRTSFVAEGVWIPRTLLEVMKYFDRLFLFWNLKNDQNIWKPKLN